MDEKEKKALAEFKKHNEGLIPVDLKVAGVGVSGSISAWNLSGETEPGGIGGAEGSVKLDIDVSGTVEAIGDAVGNVASGVAEFFDWITPW